MKKILFSILAVVTVLSLAACKTKEEQKEPVSTPSETTSSSSSNDTTKPAEEMEPGTTDESIVSFVLEDYLKAAFPDAIEEVIPTYIKVFTKEEIAAEEGLATYTINEGDIVFSADYELKIKEGYEDLNSFTAGTGEIDGNYIRNKSNVGIVRNHGEEGYSIDAFGTGW